MMAVVIKCGCEFSAEALYKGRRRAKRSSLKIRRVFWLKIKRIVNASSHAGRLTNLSEPFVNIKLPS